MLIIVKNGKICSSETEEKMTLNTPKDDFLKIITITALKSYETTYLGIETIAYIIMEIEYRSQVKSLSLLGLYVVE